MAQLTFTPWAVLAFPRTERSVTLDPYKLGSERTLAFPGQGECGGPRFPGSYSGSAFGTFLPFLVGGGFLQDRFFFIPLFQTMETLIYCEKKYMIFMYNDKVRKNLHPIPIVYKPRAFTHRTVWPQRKSQHIPKEWYHTDYIFFSPQCTDNRNQQ